MEKVILVIDIPEKCGDCPCSNFFSEYGYSDKCSLTGAWIEYGSKPKNCPLKPLPDRKVVKPEDTTAAVAVKYGWNNCLNEILKEEEEWR